MGFLDQVVALISFVSVFRSGSESSLISVGLLDQVERFLRVVSIR